MAVSAVIIMAPVVAAILAARGARRKRCCLPPTAVPGPAATRYCCSAVDRACEMAVFRVAGPHGLVNTNAGSRVRPARSGSGKPAKRISGIFAVFRIYCTGLRERKRARRTSSQTAHLACHILLETNTQILEKK